ncbi:ribosome hibernation-promoting factor, HPF/YfiA family [Dermatophilus congolensis]|uniref:Ribosome hibernation promoting factor n=1 Tax=Dermatophilus congolensis TaxID=1863 RepID=A0A239VJ98_9MICO|nr:ribosome-associated translation inhibitor RaiA [Dermatophilus congolensis]MBO3129065.1 ribosome-associated translation inhibitor RaiA [Dermatophilus congolensis]MBO3132299.1 ribosome-associated translation inhibitor RaiA [Dermatophilus congolensis]MBO3133541.1 ribosome-associated translation inhibitor RaiA [Dermatophilus congolensis]MBO3135774.1 ribosome-associated translation inhibitor RaiA [Dermatophilus congolensis]MBO3138013.1 ribosome-associated translation inhibitor RaiA [Dermatophilu
MELTVTARHVQVSDRFRSVLEEKIEKIEHLAPRAQRVEVIVGHETSRNAPKGSVRVEITCIAKGPVLRAEAFADDPYSALDLVLAKLSERLRRANSKKKVRRHRGPDLATATADLDVVEAMPPGGSSGGDEVNPLEAKLGVTGDSPVQVREKVHASSPMTLDQALYEMELVGHDFYLFHDKDSDSPCVVYRRRGWDYGVIRLEVSEAEDAAQ